MRRRVTTLLGVHASELPSTAVGAGRRFLGGATLLLRGVRLYVRSPGLMLLGVIPALISGAIFLTAYALLVFFVDDLAAAATPFADDWATTPRSAVRVVAGLAFLGLGGLLTVLTFTAVTLVIGDPFYEKISERVERRYGGTPDEVEVPFWPSLRRSAADSLRLVALAALFGLPLFAAGFIPLVGQTVVPVIGAAVGGWLLAVGTDRRALLPARQATAAPARRAEGGPPHRTRLRGRGLRLFPDPARRRTADAGRGGRCHPVGPPFARPTHHGGLTWTSPWSRETSPASGWTWWSTPRTRRCWAAAESTVRSTAGVDRRSSRSAARCAPPATGGLPTGQAVATTAGELPARWVVHTVGPVWSDTEDRTALLRGCYTNSLAVADELGAASIAFPLISAGVYGWPVEDAVRQALSVLRSATPTTITEARLVLFGADTHAIAERVYAEGQPPGRSSRTQDHWLATRR